MPPRDFSLGAVLFSLREQAYTYIASSKYALAITSSIIYIFLLVGFAHVDVIFTLHHKHVADVGIALNEIVYKHAHILSLVANTGLLVMLFIDLLMANRHEGTLASTMLNIVGVLSMIGIFWCAVGCEPGKPNLIGGLGNRNGCLFAFVVFITTLFFLKFITLRPQDQ